MWLSCTIQEDRLIPVLLFICAVPGAAQPIKGRGVQACLPCHQSIVETYLQTTHAITSRPANAKSIKGSFTPGQNVLRTTSENTWFEMEERDGRLYQTAVSPDSRRSERFDLVIGSGRRGQTYLYWRDGLLYQLPVSWLAQAGSWIGSPGYEQGKLHFDRAVPERCLGCHVTYLSPTRRVLGISCEKCHGAVEEHAQLRRAASCASCHSGSGESGAADVHGNQVALLARSKCRNLTCSTCHNVHRPETSLNDISRNCIGCHQVRRCKVAAAAENCVDCHMPRQPSNVIVMSTGRGVVAQWYRNHTIGVYR